MAKEKAEKEIEAEFPNDNQKPYALFKTPGGGRKTTYDAEGNSVYGISDPEVVAIPILNDVFSIGHITSLVNDERFVYLKHNIHPSDSKRQKVAKYLEGLAR